MDPDEEYVRNFFVRHGATAEDMEFEKGPYCMHRVASYHFNRFLYSRYREEEEEKWGTAEHLEWTTHADACTNEHMIRCMQTGDDYYSSISDEYKNDTQVACFHCVKIFDATGIKEFKYRCAICPHCGYDTIVPRKSYRGVKVTLRLLEQMHDFWFVRHSNYDWHSSLYEADRREDEHRGYKN